MTLHAPYAFVPLSAWVYQPEWKDCVTQDLPFSDGLSGSFDIEITAHTPILCGVETNSRANHDGQDFDCSTIEFFRLPNGDFAIPGSTLRGMLRNVLEIVAFGRMHFVDDARFGVRDLVATADEYYARRLAPAQRQETGTGWSVRPAMRAGFLWFDKNEKPGDQWKILPCEWARVPFAELSKLRKKADWNGWIRQGRDKPDYLGEDVDKRYRKWGENQSTEINLFVQDARFHDHRGGSIKVLYRRAVVPRAGETAQATRGEIVFTGQPQYANAPNSESKSAKTQEFFFFGFDWTRRHETSLTVSQDVVDAFIQIHDPKDGRRKNANWDYWERKLKNSGFQIKIPVFYLEDKEQVETFGLAMMFKMAHKLKVKEVLAHTRHVGHSMHVDDKVVDLATVIFGRARADDHDLFGWKGRVSFGSAKASPKPSASGETSELTPLDLPLTLLMAPKPQFYPAYIRQPREADDLGLLRADRELVEGKPKRSYASYTPIANADYPEQREPQLAGWKTYPAKDDYKQAVLPPRIRNIKGIARKLKPLRAHTAFTTAVRFHNLRPAELGALFWALRLGGDRKLRHKVGMARPFGFGEVSIEIARFDDFKWNGAAGRQKSVEDFEECFVRLMSNEYGKVHAAEQAKGVASSWLSSEQIRTFISVCSPEVGKKIKHLLEYVAAPKDFADAKKEGLILPPYPYPASRPGPGERKDRGLRPRGHADAVEPRRTASRPDAATRVRGYVFRRNQRVIHPVDGPATVLEDVPAGAREMNVKLSSGDIERVDTAGWKSVD